MENGVAVSYTYSMRETLEMKSADEKIILLIQNKFISTDV